MRWSNPLYLEEGDLFTVCTSPSIFLPRSAEPNECVTRLNSTAQVLCRASWHPVWVKWGRAPFAFQFCIWLLRERQHGHKGEKAKAETLQSLTLIVYLSGDQTLSGSRKLWRISQAKQFLAVVGTNVIIDYENRGMEQDGELCTFTGPILPVYWRSLLSADFWVNHPPCAMEMRQLSKHEEHQTLSNDYCGTFRCLNQSQTSPRKISSQKSELEWAKQQREKQFSSTWKCLILLFLAAFEKVLFSVIFCLLPSCTNHAGISLSVWMHFFSKLSDKCGCKMTAQERGYAWKCQSQPHKEMVWLGISFIRISIHGDFQVPNVK